VKRVSDTELLRTADVVARRARRQTGITDLLRAAFVAGYQFAHGMKIETGKKR